MANTKGTEKGRQLTELRLSNAATAIPAKKVRKQCTRAGRKSAAIRDSRGD